MEQHVQSCFPEEACGLLGGRQEGNCITVAAVLPVENMLHSSTRFRMEPLQQLNTMVWLENQGLELVGIFHSHPTGPDRPSSTDLTEFAYPGTLMLIWFPAVKGQGWTMRCFGVVEKDIFPVRVELSQVEE